MTAAMPIPADPVLAMITGKDLLDQLAGVNQSVQTLTVKLDHLPAQVTDHESRLRRLEYRQWFAAGVASVSASAITGAILSALGHH